MSDTRLKIAVFIDFDNVEIGVKTTLNLQFDIGAVLEAIKERGEVITKVAYGDWKRSGEHGRAMAQHAVRMVQRVMTPGGDKNGADINLALDALEMAFTHSHINAFVIVGGDSDFITLVEKLKQYRPQGVRRRRPRVHQPGDAEELHRVHRLRERRPDFRQRVPRPADAGAGRRRRAARSGSGTQSIEQAVPLVKRALKVLTDREVSPQLGLLKSTLLQLDSSFSERDYGVGTFREFADKLAEARIGLAEAAGPQHAGRAARCVRLRSNPPSGFIVAQPQADSCIDQGNAGAADASCSSSRIPVPAPAERRLATAWRWCAECSPKRPRRRAGRCIRANSSSSCKTRSRISTSAVTDRSPT